MWVSGTQVLQSSPVASFGLHEQEAGSEAEQGLKPGTLMQDAGGPNTVLTTANSHFALYSPKPKDIRGSKTSFTSPVMNIFLGTALSPVLGYDLGIGKWLYSVLNFKLQERDSFNVP